ncbi:hypothetical protein MKX01_020097 [Papaver californicum]|nr:hypothetical protein MKX01_020097 [Papaver californicum]
MRQHIMSPAAYYYQKPSFPQQLFNTHHPKPSLPPTPQLFIPFYQKPSFHYSTLPFFRPPQPPPFPHHHQQQPLHVSAKTQEYYLQQKTTSTTSTSVMMRNIPTSISRRMLMEIIVDQHCIEENKKALAMLNHEDQDMILSEYDFLYLPMDFVRRGNLGYAFINFTTSVAAMRFYKSFDNFSWKDSMFIETTKICKICPSRLQGKDGHVGHFKNSYFKCDTDEFLPISFSPPRNGSTSRPLPTIVGKRQRRSRMRMHIQERINHSLSINT